MSKVNLLQKYMIITLALLCFAIIMYAINYALIHHGFYRDGTRRLTDEEKENEYKEALVFYNLFMLIYICKEVIHIKDNKIQNIPEMCLYILVALGGNMMIRNEKNRRK